MIDVDIKKLAALSRIEVSDDELTELSNEIPSILAFVEQVAEVSDMDTKYTGEHFNVLREDDHTHESGMYTKELLASVPHTTDDGYIKVRKIITQD